MQLAISLLHQIQLLFRVGSTEVVVGRFLQILLPLQPFDNQVVFPEFPDIVTQIKGVEVVDQGIAHPVIDEIIPAVLVTSFRRLRLKPPSF